MKKFNLIICITFIILSTFAQKKHTYHNYAFDNKVLNGKISAWGPSFVDEDLIFTIDLSEKTKYNYTISFGEQSDIKFIGFVFSNKTDGSENKHIYPGQIKIRGEQLKKCVIMSRDWIDKFFLGNINETSLDELVVSQHIEIRYDDLFGSNIRYLYPIKLRPQTEASIRFWEEAIKSIDEKEQRENNKLDSIQRKKLNDSMRGLFGEKPTGKNSKKLKDLSTREMIKGTFKKPNFDVDDKGIVVVDIIVDPKGDVIETSIGKGTTTNNASLRSESLKATKKIKYNKIDSNENQQGSVTYHFHL